MNLKLILITPFLFTGCILCSAQNIVRLADSIRQKNEIPEMAFAIVSPDKIIEQEYLGHHKIGQTSIRDTANSKDYFHLGSNTKAITGFIAAYLVENHKIKWTTKLFDLFPEWKKQSDTTYYNVTLQDLLSHRARIEPYTVEIERDELPNFPGSKPNQRQQFAAYVLKEKPVIVSKTLSYNYSNAGYAIAAVMLEKATGKTWEELVVNVMNNELHLNVVFGWPNKISDNEPWGHWIENNKLTPLPATTSYNLGLIEPAGDISMALPDYIKFIQLNLTGLAGKDNVLKAETYNFLHYGVKGYSIGWSNLVTDKQKLSDHAGSAGTFYCYTLIDALKSRAYIIIINCATAQAQTGVSSVIKLLKEKN